MIKGWWSQGLGRLRVGWGSRVGCRGQGVVGSRGGGGLGVVKV